MFRFTPARPVVLLTIVVLLSTLAAAPASAAKPGGIPSTDRAVLFASDGMRPDLMEKYAAEGAMPTYADLMANGVRGDNGMVQAFPPNTGVGWYTIATGTYPSEHGSTNNTFFRSGDTFSNRTSFSGTGVLQADTIANEAERAGKKVAQVEWVGGRSAAIAGPTVDFANFFSTRGVLTTPAVPTEQNGAAAFGVSYQIAAFAAAAGWSNVPAGDPAAPPEQAILTVATSFAAQNPTRVYDLYVYDSVVDGTPAYDHVVMVRSAAAKNGSQAATTLAVGDFNEIKLTGADGLIGTRAGQTAGFYVKLITLAPDLSTFKLYFTSVERVIATCATAACNALPAGGAGEDRLEKYIAEQLPTAVSADFAPEEAGIIDEDTYIEQGRDLEAAYGDAVLNYILGTLQPDTDLAMVGYPFTDEVSHQFMALVTPTDIDGNPNPCYDVTPKFDDVTCTGAGTAGRVAIREGYIRSAYAAADAKLKLARDLMGGAPTTIAASDHGFAPQWWAVNARKVLFDASVGGRSLSASSANTASNCGADTTDLTKACWAGGTIQIYVNNGQTFDRVLRPTAPTYEEVRTAIIAAFQGLADANNPGAQVVARVMTKEELRNVDGSDSLHPNRSGDVVVVLRPPYQSDAGTSGQAIALSHFFGQHGYMPELVDIAHNVNMHATFVASGKGIAQRDQPIAGVRAIDLAPTLSFLLRIPGPQNARGRILYDIVPGGQRFTEVTILNISDWHANLVPLSEQADTVGASFGIAGAAFLKPWFDVYRSEATGGSITITGGDSFGGATPPISNAFGDTPTPPIMGLMGVDADGIGNHNFDRGEAYLRNTLIPLAPFPMVSANVVFANGKTPAEWSPSTVFTVGGVKVGLIGCTTEAAPSLIFPGNLGPFEIRSIVPAVQAEADRLRSQRAGIVAVVCHEGATGGTTSAPTGPIVDIADALTGVDAVLGDHNDQQVASLRSNGVLLTENRGKGIRFTRIRLVVDASGKQVVYKTADYHKPWNIGVTPDPAIQSRIDDLNAQLGPIFNTLVGNSTKAVPRADQCGGGTGRTCESLVGDLVADSMRTTYSSIGTQFAITNSGGLRADLTCPTTDSPSDFCPASLYPFAAGVFPITRGQVLGVLPFGNIVVTVSISGAELKTMLENGVSRMPAVDGRFPQVSGLCFTYDIAAPAGSRVTAAVLADALGNCTATAVDLTAASTYTIAQNDFTANGGDGYPNVYGRSTSQAIMDQVLADYIAANTPVSPVVKAAPDGRINCTDSNGPGVGNDCPVLVPSP
jgi:2',3'-cyclic-nucleotide 2'-phosphodiesterase (5'-nucleotidase family)